MRNFIIALLVLPLFVACNQKELKQLRTQNQELTLLVQQKDSTINDFIETLNTIEENLAIIKEKEKVIAVNAQENADKTQKEKIVSDITLINNLLAQNKRDLKSLKKKLNHSWYKNSQLTKTVDRLQEQLLERETEVAALNEKVAKLNLDVENLNGKVDELNSTVADLNTENENKTKVIEETTTKLNTAYYVAGTTRELVEKQIVVPSGGFIGIGVTQTLNRNLNDGRFTKIDITKTTSIPVSGKKVKLLTSHPNGSYKFEGADVVESITILDPEKFWKASKYLVVSAR